MDTPCLEKQFQGLWVSRTTVQGRLDQQTAFDWLVEFMSHIIS